MNILTPLIILRKTFLFPSTILVAITTYSILHKRYKDEIKSDIKNANLDSFQIFLAANNLIFDRTTELNEYLDFINTSTGFLRYVICIVFWVSVINIFL